MFYSLTFIASFTAVVISALVITYYALLFSCLEGCSVEKNTLHWCVTMQRSTICNIPLINPIGGAKYYYGGELGERWEVIYTSKSELNQIQKEIKNYLIGKKMQLSNTQFPCYNGYWEFDNETVTIPFKSKERCIMIYLDKHNTHVLVRALEMD